MIRDEFKGEKKVTTKEARKKAVMGERNFYASQAVKLKELVKAVSFTNKFSIITFGLCYACILAVFLLSLHTDTPYSTVKFIIWTSLFGAFVIWFILWFAIIKKRTIEKADRYTKELERLSRESLIKIGNAYKVYGDDYIEKLKKQAKDKEEKLKGEQI